MIGHNHFGRHGRRSGRRLNCAVAEALEHRWLLATFMVTNINDSGIGSLRQAIFDSNTAAGKDTIAFNLPAGSKTITLSSALPDITSPVNLDGKTLVGWSMTNQISLRPANTTSPPDGLRILTGYCDITGFSISGFANGIYATRTYANDAGNTYTYNTITGNTGAGIRVVSGFGDVIRFNSIDNNGGMGIDEGQAGPSGTPEAQENSIEVGHFYRIGTGNDVGVEWSWYASKAGTWTFDFYVSPAYDSTYYGEGRTYIGSYVHTTSAAGPAVLHASFTTTTQIPYFQYVTVTMVSDRGTSEFGHSHPLSDFVALVTNTSESGPGSLRQAVIDFQASQFNIYSGQIWLQVPGSTAANPARIVLSNSLPEITRGLAWMGPGPGFEPLSTQIERKAGAPLFNAFTFRYNYVLEGIRIANFNDGIYGSSGDGRITNCIITGNLRNGILETGDRLLVTRSSIYSNGLLGIDLGNNGVTANDVGDADSGPSGLLNYPVLDSAVGAADRFTISGTFNSYATNTFTIEFFSNDIPDSSGYGEGQRYLGSGTVVTDVSGNSSFAFTLPVTVLPGVSISATTTYGYCTSEFSRCIVSTGNEALVTNNNDSGAGSLRQAILNANAAAGTQTVYFQLPSDQRTIQPLTPLPAITDSLLIDGTNLPGYTVSNRVTLDGSLISGHVDGLSIQASNGIIKGLAITGFENGLVVSGSNNTIGGSTASANVIFRNRGDGVRVVSGVGNSIRYNRIVHNTGLAIDLGADGVTPNDPSDTDGGANTLVNAPAIVGAHIFQQNVTVTGSYQGAPNQTFLIDVFLVRAVDDGQAIVARPSEFLSTTTVLTDAAGIALFTLNVPFGSTNAASVFVASASDVQGNTSEFSAPATITTAPFTVTTNADSGPGSLRQAIADANAAPGLNTVRFDLPTTGTDPFTIRLQSALPQITDPVVIDGTSQTGIGGSGITLLAPTATANVDGIVLAGGASGSTLKHLTLDLFRHGLTINCSNTIVGTAGGLLRVKRAGGDGVRVLSGISNNLRFARIESAGGLRIDLGGDGATANDPLDADTGPNAFLNTPALTAFTRDRTNPVVEGMLDSAPSSSYTVDFFLASTGEWLTSKVVSTDALGHATFRVAVGVSNTSLVMATASDSAGNTSECSNVTTADFSPLLVTTTADSGAGSLRDAITRANALAGTDSIHFAIGGVGPHQINVGLTSLPSLTELCTIDATTQPGFAGAPVIHLHGPGPANGGTTGLVVGSGSERSVVRGLAIGGFYEGIRISAHYARVEGCYLGLDSEGAADPNRTGLVAAVWGATVGGTVASARNVVSGNLSYGLDIIGNENVIQGNFIGTNPAGNAAVPNNSGVRIFGSNNVLGGALAAARNVISGNTSSGAVLESTYYYDSGSVVTTPQYSRVQGNYIGTAADGLSPLGNGGDGLLIVSQYATIGGLAAGERNVIAFNNERGVHVTTVPASGGIARFITIRGNAIHSNGLLGIDLGNDGMTPNDTYDLDNGPNALANFPMINSATANTTSISVTGSYHGLPNSTQTLDFYASPLPDPAGYGEGEIYLVSTVVTLDYMGNASFNLSLPLSVAGRNVSATATDVYGNTSEFSASVYVVDDVPPQVQSNFLECSGPALGFNLRFSENVSGSLAVESLVIQKNADGTTFTADSMTYDLVTNTATFFIPKTLSAGDYHVYLAGSGVQDSAGNHPGDMTFDFWYLPCDSNRDRAVNFDDLVAVAQNYEMRTSSWALGDFNGDGVVNFDDLSMLAQLYMTSLPPLAPALVAQETPTGLPAKPPVESAAMEAAGSQPEVAQASVQPDTTSLATIAVARPLAVNSGLALPGRAGNADVRPVTLPTAAIAAKASSRPRPVPASGPQRRRESRSLTQAPISPRAAIPATFGVKRIGQVDRELFA